MGRPLRFPPTPDTSYMQRYQSGPKNVLRSTRKSIATNDQAGAMQSTPYKATPKQNKGRGAIEQRDLSVASCSGPRSGYRESNLPQICVQRPVYQTAPSGLSFEANLTARLEESQQWHVHLNMNNIIKSAPWGIVTSCGAATGTTYPPKTLQQ